MINFQALRERARALKIELIALALAARHPQTPWYAKLVVAGCVAYALTPVDLVPDAIPVIGFIDDLIFIPLAIALAVRFIPAPVLADCRSRSHEIEARAPRLSWPARILIGLAWLTVIVLIAYWAA
ncbi:MAG TPA: YkvA family protein [Burkholderiales bacterium]|nr:YkvA family protein [Burkholderiales bacterium]